MKKRILYALVAVLISVPLLVYAFGIQRVWTGGFQTAEYQILFVDAQGRPVPDVELQVTDVAGRVYHYFPVTDDVPRSPPRSAADGVLTFHHLNTSFDGRCQTLFGEYEYGKGCEGPNHVCHFLRGGMEVAQIPFRQLDRLAQEHEWDKVTRTWNWANMGPARTAADEPEAWMARIRREADKDGDGTLNMEEGAAYQSIVQHSDKTGTDRLTAPKIEQLTFPVVKKTIQIP